MEKFGKIYDRQSQQEVLEHCHNLKIANSHQTTDVTQNLKAAYRIRRNRRMPVIMLIIKQGAKLGFKYILAVLSIGSGVVVDKEIETMRY